MMYLWKLRGNYPCVVRIFCSFFLEIMEMIAEKINQLGILKSVLIEFL